MRWRTCVERIGSNRGGIGLEATAREGDDAAMAFRLSLPRNTRTRRVAVLIFPRLQALDAVGPFEVFSITNRLLAHARHIFSLLIAVAALLSAQSGYAATFTVTKIADTNDGTCDADCSLREAIIAANSNPGADDVTVPAGTYVLDLVGADEDASATGDLDIFDELTLTGAGADQTIIDGNSSDRVMEVFSTVEISGVTIGNGNADLGGGIFNSSTLTLTYSIISDNSADNSDILIGGGGVGIFNSGTLTVTTSTISGYTAGGVGSVSAGGGILNAGTLTVNISTITGN